MSFLFFFLEEDCGGGILTYTNIRHARRRRQASVTSLVVPRLLAFHTYLPTESEHGQQQQQQQQQQFAGTQESRCVYVSTRTLKAIKTVVCPLSF